MTARGDERWNSEWRDVTLHKRIKMMLWRMHAVVQWHAHGLGSVQWKKAPKLNLNLNADTERFTFYYCSCPAVSPEVWSSSSIRSLFISMSSSIFSSPPVASLSRAASVQYCRPRCLWPRRTLRLRPFLFGPNDNDWVKVVDGLGQEEEGEDCLDFKRGLRTSVEDREGGWLGSVWEHEEIQGAWCSCSGCGTDVEDGPTVKESGASEQPAASLSAAPLRGESERTRNHNQHVCDHLNRENESWLHLSSNLGHC